MEDGLLPPGKSLCTLLPLLMANSMPDPVIGREVALQTACSIVSRMVQWFQSEQPPQTHLFKHLVPSWWNCLGRVRRHDLVGGRRASKNLWHSLSLPYAFGSRCELSVAAPVPCQPARLPTMMVTDSNPLEQQALN